MLPTPNCRCRSIGSCRTLPGPRDTPAANRPPKLGALPWAFGSSTSVCISGSGKRRFVCPDFMRRSIEEHTEGPESAFLWRSDTVSFGAVKRNGVGKGLSRAQSLNRSRAPALGFASFSHERKGGRRKARPCPQSRARLPLPFLCQARSRREQPGWTAARARNQGQHSCPVSSPRRREAGRREQAQRDGWRCQKKWGREK